MKRLISTVLTGAMVLTLLAGCGSSKGTSEKIEEKDTKGKAVKVALIASSSGLGDRSFNDAAWEGFQKAEKELGAEIKVVEPANVADYLSSASTLANAGYDLIFATGNDWGDTLTEAAASYPDTKFVGLNVTAEGENIAVAQTADHEIGFLVGALAGMMSKSGTIGFLGGKEVPSQTRFNVGYTEGVAYAAPDDKVLTTYVGAFNDPSKGKEFALELISQGADIIFHTAGKSGEGLFEVVKDTEDVYAIGVDSEQDYIVEGKVLTTAEKNLATIAYDMIEKVQNNKFQNGINVYNLENGGVGLSEMKYTKDIIGEENITKLEEIKADIISGKIKVTDTFAE